MKREYFKKSLIGIILGMALIPLNLITTYIAFGQNGYLYELEQISSVNELIYRIIISMIGLTYFCFTVLVTTEPIEKEELAKSTVMKETARLLLSMIMYAISFSILYFIKDVYFIVSYVVNIEIAIIIGGLIRTIYSLELKNKINKKIEEKNKTEEK